MARSQISRLASDLYNWSATVCEVSYGRFLIASALRYEVRATRLQSNKLGLYTHLHPKYKIMTLSHVLHVISRNVCT